MIEIPKPFWYRYRFSLKVLFITITIAILVIAAYGIGYQHGRLMHYDYFMHQQNDQK